MKPNLGCSRNVQQDLNLYRSIFDRTEKFKLILFLISQSSLALLDLVGVLLFGALGSMLILGPGTDSSLVKSVLANFGIENSDFREQVIILSILILVTLLSRTIITSSLTRRLNLFLAKKNAQISAELLKRIMHTDLSATELVSHQEFLIAIVRGTHSFLIRQVASTFGLIVDAMLLVVLFGGLFVLNPFVSTLTLSIFVCLALGIFKVTHSRVARLSSNELKFSVKVNERITDVLNSNRTIRLNGNSDFFVKTLEREKMSQARALAELAYLPIFNKYASEIGLVLAGFGFGAVVFSFFENSKAISFLGIFLASSLRIAPALLRIQQHFLNIRSSSTSSRVFSDFYSKFRPVSSLSGTSNAVINCSKEIPPYGISLKNVSAVSAGGVKLLQNVNLEIPFGSKVVILGESGSGKSSLIDILIGIRKPSEGSIEWGCSKNHPNCYCHGEIGFVPQKYNLIRGSLRENILLGRDGIEDFEIIRFIDLLGLSSLLSDCVEGLDTQIGDGAKQLSGGEAQRLALIAALISRPKILVLDEATSALDAENQKLVKKYFEKELHEITLIMVTHNPHHYRDSWSTLHLRHGCVSVMKKE